MLKRKEDRAMNKRSTKFYRKNEAEVMKRLGFKPTKNSGAGWVEKCDGENELFICELKSTDKESYTLKQKTLQELEYHACVAHKIPVFALQFLNRDEIWVVVKEDEFKEYMKFKKQKQIERHLSPLLEQEEETIDSFVDKEEKEKYNVYMPSRNAGKTYLARHAYMKQKEQEREKNAKEFRKRKKELERKNRERRKKVGKEV